MAGCQAFILPPAGGKCVHCSIGTDIEIGNARYDDSWDARGRIACDKWSYISALRSHLETGKVLGAQGLLQWRNEASCFFHGDRNATSCLQVRQRRYAASSDHHMCWKCARVYHCRSQSSHCVLEGRECIGCVVVSYFFQALRLPVCRAFFCVQSQIKEELSVVFCSIPPRTREV